MEFSKSDIASLTKKQQEKCKLIGNFSRFIMEEATENYNISFRDGDPRETFFDYFNSKFDSDANFCEMLNLIMEKIEQMSPDDKRRIVDLQIFVKPNKNYEN